MGIDPVDLPPGNYILASQVYSGSADRYLHDAAVSSEPGITWSEGRHANGSTVLYPTNVTTNPASWFGPNFLFEPLD